MGLITEVVQKVNLFLLKRQYNMQSNLLVVLVLGTNTNNSKA